MPAPTVNAALPRFVELVRVSSATQAARETPEDQRAALDRLRLSRPGRLVERIEAAEGISGALGVQERRDLRRLLELAAARAFDEVRVRHLDRLTRHPDLRERALIFGAIADAGAVIVDGGGRVLDPRTELGELDYVLQTMWAARERARIAERTMAAKVRLAKEGRLVGGRVPFARTWDGRSGTWGVDREKASLYRRMFELCLSGASLRRIAAILNAEGAVTGTGREWGPARVGRLLRDPVATGRYRTHGATVQIPAIVDEATWRAAVERLRGNSGHLSGRPAKHPALLRKLLTCGECGAPLYVDKGGTRPHRQLYYRCSGGGPCGVYHQVAAVDVAVREVVERFLRRPDALSAAAGYDAPEDEAEAATRDARAAERELRDLDRQEERLARLARRGLLSARVQASQLAEVARLRATAQEQVRCAGLRREAAARRGEFAAELETRIRALRDGLARATLPEWASLMGVLFPRTPTTGVRIWPDGRVELRGTVSLDDQGAVFLGHAAPKLSQFPGRPEPARSWWPAPSTPARRGGRPPSFR